MEAIVNNYTRDALDKLYGNLRVDISSLLQDGSLSNMEFARRLQDLTEDASARVKLIVSLGEAIDNAYQKE